jgi:hypothetical protein
VKSISPNDFVRVKLTEAGKQLLVRSTDELNECLKQRGPQCTFRARVPEWDRDGWLKDQFHSIMGHFGDCWRLGSQMPFIEMEICDESN